MSRGEPRDPAAACAWTRSGTGEVQYVLIHGLACRGTQWEPVAALLGQGASVITVDLPGHGSSADLAGPYTIDRFAEAVAEVIARECTAPVVLVGHSMGAAVAVSAAALCAQQVSHVVALDSLLNPRLHSRQNRLVAAGYRALFLRPWHRPVMKRVVHGFFTDSCDPEVEEAVLTDMLRTRPRITGRALQSLARWDRDAALARLTAPLTVYQATLLHRRPAPAAFADHCEVRSFDRGGHFFFMEYPAETATEIQRIRNGPAGLERAWSG